MRPPRLIAIYAENEQQRSEWRFAIRHHSPTQAGVYYESDSSGNAAKLADLINITPQGASGFRALLIFVNQSRDALALLDLIREPVPTIVVTAVAEKEPWPDRPACICAVFPQADRWSIFETLDLISGLKRGPRKGSRRHPEPELACA